VAASASRRTNRPRHRAVTRDDHPVEPTAAFDDEKGIVSERANGVGKHHGPRRAELGDFAGFAILDIDSEQLAGRIGIDIQVAIAAKGDAVQSGTATGGGRQ
jgi:hypothetical protein